MEDDIVFAEIQNLQLDMFERYRSRDSPMGSSFNITANEYKSFVSDFALML